jgi:hypothetical protein
LKSFHFWILNHLYRKPPKGFLQDLAYGL